MMESFSQYFKAEPAASRAAWVVDRCHGPKDSLHRVIPSGFESYVRICHPGWVVAALDPDDEDAWRKLRAGWTDAEDFTAIRWDEVATRNGCKIDRLMQWHRICSTFFREKGTAGIDPPMEGALSVEMIDDLIEILASHTDPNPEVLCGFWEGYNQPHFHQARAKFNNHWLFSSTLTQVKDGWLAAREYSNRVYHSSGVVGLVPNAIWPNTGDWYLASPYNRFSSYFGGPTDMANQILSNGALETYTASPGDDIWKDGTEQPMVRS